MKKTEVRPNKRKKNQKSRKKKTNQGSPTSENTVYGKKVKNPDGPSSRISFPKIKPWKVIVGAIVLGLLGMLYLNHVFATQELLREVQQLEREYNQTKRLHSNYRLTYDRMIGPAEIYDQANNRGFINGGPAEKIIEVE